jgi:hypothetical protein
MGWTLRWSGCVPLTNNRTYFGLATNCALAVLSRIAAVCGRDGIWRRHTGASAPNHSGETRAD